MAQGRGKTKKKRQSRRKVHRTLEERHRLGLSATARAAAARAAKAAA